MKHLPLNTYEYERLNRDFYGAIYARGYKGYRGGGYADSVREFLFFMENKGIYNIGEVKIIDILSYHEYLKERPHQRKEGGISESHIRRMLYSVKLFFDYLLDAGEIRTTPANLPRFKITRKNERAVCTLEEIKLIYSVCSSKQERALISIAYGCGLRRNEIEKLNVTDIQMHKGILTVREGKNTKSRTVPMSDVVLRDLKEYIIYERPKLSASASYMANEALFIGFRGNRIDGARLCEKLKEIILRTNNTELISKGITLHCLRHSIATHLLDKGANIEFVQKFLGHSQIDTSHLYAKRRKQQLKVFKMIDRHQSLENEL